MSFIQGSRAQYVSRSLLVILRIYLGIIFLVAAWPKITADQGFTPRLVGFIERFGLESAHGFYRPFLESVVLPRAGLFAALVVLGELLAGLALVTGTATRVAAGVAAFLVLNYMFAKGGWFWNPSSNDAALFMIALIVLIGGAGRAFGVDYYLYRKIPVIPLW